MRHEEVIRTVITDVSDAPIAHECMREGRETRALRVAAREHRLHLAYAGYRDGVDSPVNALDADRDLFGVPLTVAQLRVQEILSAAQLYTAPGGGQL